MASGVYKFVSNINDFVYVGQAQDLDKRYRAHINMLRSGKHDNIHLQRAYDLYGEENLIYSVIEYCNINELDTIEQKYLDWAFSTGKTYNFAIYATSPMRGRKRSAEAIKKTADANRGRVRSDEHKKSMSEGAKRVIDLKMSNPDVKEKILLQAKIASDKAAEICKKPVVCLDTGEIFDSARSAAYSILGYDCKKATFNISCCCRGTANYALDRIWYYEGTEPSEKQLKAVTLDPKDREYFFRYEGCKHNYRRIKCDELGMNFDSIKDAEKFLRANGYPKATRAYINMCCLGRYQTVYGMHWSYIQGEVNNE